jgi:hypothetical protein
VVLPEGRDLAMRVKERMRSIMFGGEQHAWGVVVEEE